MTELLNTLYVQTPGTSLHLDGDAIRIYHPEQTGRRLLPLIRIDHLVIFGGVTLTDDLIIRCAGWTVHQLADQQRALPCPYRRPDHRQSTASAGAAPGRRLRRPTTPAGRRSRRRQDPQRPAGSAPCRP